MTSQDPQTPICLRLRKIVLLFFAVVVISAVLPENSTAQQSQPTPIEPPSSKSLSDQQPGSFGEMVLRQQISKRKKEHEELLKRGDEALKLAEELEKTIVVNKGISAPDVQKLQALEKIVGKIRRDLGGDEDESVMEDATGRENTARQSIVSAFKFLRDSTKELVDELKRTSRFSISVVAIRTSNAVIRFARFLRIKK